MFDSLADAWNQHQDRLQDQGLLPGQMNTAGIAGQLIASGVKPEVAYVQAAQIFRGQEQGNIERIKQERKQQQLQVASQILQQGGSLADLLAAGVDSPAILGAIPQPQWVPNKGDINGGRFVTPGQMPQQGNISQGNISMGNQGSNMSIPEQSMGPRYDAFDASELGTKASNAVKAKRVERADEYVAKVTDQASKAVAVGHTAKQLETIIPKIFSGEQLDAETKEAWSNRLGINPEQVTAGQIFTGEVSNLIGEIEREVASTRATDSAAKIIIEAKPKKGNSEKANLSLIRGIQARAVALEEKGAALAKWEEQGRDPNKFERTWAAYERKNPFIELAKDGTVKVNESNLDKWRKVIFGEEIGETQEMKNPIEEIAPDNDRQERIRAILRKRGDL